MLAGRRRAQRLHDTGTVEQRATVDRGGLTVRHGRDVTRRGDHSN
jgi:hypothetical protein